MHIRQHSQKDDQESKVWALENGFLNSFIYCSPLDCNQMPSCIQETLRFVQEDTGSNYLLVKVYSTGPEWQDHWTINNSSFGIQWEKQIFYPSIHLLQVIPNHPKHTDFPKWLNAEEIRNHSSNPITVIFESFTTSEVKPGEKLKNPKYPTTILLSEAGKQEIFRSLKEKIPAHLVNRITHTESTSQQKWKQFLTKLWSYDSPYGTAIVKGTSPTLLQIGTDIRLRE